MQHRAPSKDQTCDQESDALSTKLLVLPVTSVTTMECFNEAMLSLKEIKSHFNGHIISRILLLL